MNGLRNYFGSPKSRSVPAFTDEPQIMPLVEPAAGPDVAKQNLPLKSQEEPVGDVASASHATSDTSVSNATPAKPTEQPRARRFSFKPFSFQEQKQKQHSAPTERKSMDHATSHAHSHKHEHDHKPMISVAEEHHKEQQVAAALTKRLHKSSRSDRRAQDSALAVRALIVGPVPGVAKPKVSGILAKPQMSKIKSQLMDPKFGNKIISKLRELSPADEEGQTDYTALKRTQGPIHAVCLDHPDHEIDELHFSKLRPTAYSAPRAMPKTGNDMVDDTVDQVSQVFSDLKVVDLVTAPDLGLGQPGDSPGLLSGAVPTAETVINGFKQVTPELMALGFAFGKAFFPDHTGIYPPTDRISIFTYWWGLELALPPPTLGYLEKVESISNAVVNFLTALSLVHNGIREILPFVRYISQFIEFEYGAIKKMDLGKGVVCAATWIMPAAMIPRPWDFPDPPKSKKLASIPSGPTSETPSVQPKTETPATALPIIIEPPVDSLESKEPKA